MAQSGEPLAGREERHRWRLAATLSLAATHAAFRRAGISLRAKRQAPAWPARHRASARIRGSSRYPICLYVAVSVSSSAFRRLQMSSGEGEVDRFPWHMAVLNFRAVPIWVVRCITPQSTSHAGSRSQDDVDVSGFNEL